MARIWSDRPLGVKLAALVAAGALALAVFAVITVQALNGTGETAGELLAAAEGTEDVLLADMMHDAVRGDVLQALVSEGQGDLYQGSVGDRALVERPRPAADEALEYVAADGVVHHVGEQHVLGALRTGQELLRGPTGAVECLHGDDGEDGQRDGAGDDEGREFHAERAVGPEVACHRSSPEPGAVGGERPPLSLTSDMA